MIDPNIRSKTVSRRWVQSLQRTISITKAFTFFSTVPCELDIQNKIQIVNGNNWTIFQANSAIAQCFSAEAKMSKRFAQTVCRRVNGLQGYCQKVKIIVGSTLPYWDCGCNTFIYNLATISKFYEKPFLDKLRIALRKKRGQVLLNNVTKVRAKNCLWSR